MTRYLDITILIVAFIVVTTIRFTHPALTETQLFMQFWYVWLGMLLLGGLVFLVKVRGD